MAKKMSNVSFMPAIEGISRKLALRRETCINKDVEVGLRPANKKVIPGQTYMGVVTRPVNVIGVGTVQRSTLFMRKPMNAPVANTAALKRRVDFAYAAEWAKGALESLEVASANTAKFLAAKADFSKKIKGISAYGYQSPRGWYFAIAYAIRKENGSLPQNYALPEFDA